MARSGQERLDAIPVAIDRRDAFKQRIVDAGSDAIRCADLLAEAAEMLFEANGLEIIGRDGRVTVNIEKVMAMHCVIAAREAYLAARGSNQEPR